MATCISGNIVLIDGKPVLFDAHRIRSGGGIRRRALRPCFPADGSRRARTRQGRQYRIQPLSRRNRARGRFRRARRTSAVSFDAGRDPRQGDRSEARKCEGWRKGGDRKKRARLFRARRPSDRAARTRACRGRRIVGHRQIGSGAGACALSPARAWRRHPALRCDAQANVRRERNRHAAARGLHARM